MKISLRGSGSRTLVRKLEKSGATDLVGGIHNDLFFDSFWPNRHLDDFLRVAAKLGSFDLNPWMEFSRAEIEQANFLRLRPRKVVEDSAADFERMRSDTDDLPWIGNDPKHRFRLPNRLFLSKIRLKPNQVAVVGQWTAEYVVPRGVRTLFENARFSGIEFRPIFHPRTDAPFDEYFHLYSNHMLGFREIDIASPEILSPLPDEQGYDPMGCFCYTNPALEDALDFNRTGEPDVGFQFPEWVVRSSVRAMFQEHKLKGWAFEPVLELGSKSYEEYNELWSSLYRVLAECMKHTVRGRYP